MVVAASSNPTSRPRTRSSSPSAPSRVGGSGCRPTTTARRAWCCSTRRTLVRAVVRGPAALRGPHRRARPARVGLRGGGVQSRRLRGLHPVVQLERGLGAPADPDRGDGRRHRRLAERGITSSQDRGSCRPRAGGSSTTTRPMSRRGPRRASPSSPGATRGTPTAAGPRCTSSRWPASSSLAGTTCRFGAPAIRAVRARGGRRGRPRAQRRSADGLSAGAVVGAHRRPPDRRHRRRHQRPALPGPPGSPARPGGAGAPRAPRAVAHHLPRLARATGLVDREPAHARRLPRRRPPHGVRQLPPRPRGPRGRARPHPRRAQRARRAARGPFGPGLRPHLRPGEARAAQAGRSRLPRRRGPARRPPRPRAGRDRRRLVARPARAGGARPRCRGPGRVPRPGGRRPARRAPRLVGGDAAPSVKEGWGLAVMEAAAQGTPTIAYRSAGGVAESVVHGETGCSSTTWRGWSSRRTSC